ncbi:MAG: M24 family metallopeptidase [Actinomycetota bacterium]|nr:M24 family metallopeptidase [Actinomycetota bacterium]
MKKFNYDQWSKDAQNVAKILANAPDIDKQKRIEIEEFKDRQNKVIEALQKNGIDAALVYSDEHYNGDVPYLGGNTNISIEPVAGVIGKNGFHIIAGLEGGYVAEQLAGRSGSKVHKVEMLKLADEDYPVEAERVEDVIEEACGGKPETIGLLTPRAVLPVQIYEFLEEYLGDREKIVDAQEIYYKIKYEKSETEMELIKDASLICDEMLKGMLAVLRPGMLETQVSEWGYLIGQELGAEEMGFDVMVTANEANRTLIGKALNREIKKGDMVHLGVAPKRDGLTACERVSVVCTENPDDITDFQKYWLNFIEEAFETGLQAYKKVAEENLPAKQQEQALVDYFKSRQDEVEELLGKKIDLAQQKPYTGTHNAGYTECQEFYGAITLNSNDPLGHRIVTMLDVAIRGTGSKWNDIVIPGLDFILVEKTLGKFGKSVEVLNKLPVNVQGYVGKQY